MKKLRVVLDTNVLVAGTRSRNGASFQILAALPSGRFEFLASVPLFTEYEAALKREEHRQASGLSLNDVDILLGFWAGCCHPVHLHYLWRPQLRDPKDEMVLETAVNGGAHAIVTHNCKDFEGAVMRFGIEVWPPAKLLTALRQVR